MQQEVEVRSQEDEQYIPVMAGPWWLTGQAGKGQDRQFPFPSANMVFPHYFFQVNTLETLHRPHCLL